MRIARLSLLALTVTAAACGDGTLLLDMNAGDLAAPPGSDLAKAAADLKVTDGAVADMVKTGDLTIHSICGQPGDPGNNMGVGKFCTVNSDCTGTAKLCTYASAPQAGAYFCTMICTPGSTDCGDGSVCASQMGFTLCVPGACIPSQGDMATPNADLTMPANADLAMPASADLATPAAADLATPATADLATPATADLAAPATADLATPATADLAVASSPDLAMSMTPDLAMASPDLVSPFLGDIAITSACGQPGDPGNEVGVGKFCTANADCAGAATLCSIVAAPASGAYFCTQPCDGNTNCGQGASCVDAGGGFTVCIPVVCQPSMSNPDLAMGAAADLAMSATPDLAAAPDLGTGLVTVNIDDTFNWCSVTVTINGTAATPYTSGSKPFQVTPGTTIDITAEPLPGFTFPIWYGGAQGLMTMGSYTATGAGSQSIAVCCPFETGGGCPALP